MPSPPARLFVLLILALALTAVESAQRGLNLLPMENFMDQGAHYVWRRKENLPKPLSDFGIATVEGSGSAYITGGCHGVNENKLPEKPCDSMTNALLRYDAETDSYAVLASMSTARVRHGSAILNNKLYVFGGRDFAEHVLPNAEVYDIAANTWSALPSSANVPVSDFCMFVLSDTIYYVGGYTDEYNVMDTVFQFDPAANTWTQLNVKLNFARGDCFSTVSPITNKALIAGGFDGLFDKPLDTIEEFDGSNFTVLAARLSPARGDAAMCTIAFKQFIFGGEDLAREARDEIQVLSNGKLAYAGELPIRRYRLHCAALTPNSIHVFGGQDTSTDFMSERVDEFSIQRIFDDLEARLETPLRLTGSPNTQRWLLHVGSLLKSHSRSPVKVSYRAVDSLRAQQEFMGTDATDNYAVDDLYLSDVALTTDRFNTLAQQGHGVLQIPIALNPLGVYIYLPHLSTEERIVLNACQLADIFNAEKKHKWSAFSSLPGLDDIDVVPLRQGDDTSMTVAFMAYLASECAERYSEQQFRAVPVSETRSPPQANQGEIIFTWLAHLLPGTEYLEAHLPNQFGTVQRIRDATVSVNAARSMSFTGDMNNVPILRYDLERSWPVASVTFAIARVDQTAAAQTGALLVTFLDLLLQKPDRDVAAMRGVMQLPKAWNEESALAIKNAIRLAANARAYSLYDETGANGVESDYSISLARKDMTDIDLYELHQQVGALRAQVGSRYTVAAATAAAAADRDVLMGIAVAALVFALLGFILATYSACKLRRIAREGGAARPAASGAKPGAGINDTGSVSNV